MTKTDIKLTSHLDQPVWSADPCDGFDDFYTVAVVVNENPLGQL